MTDLKVTYYVQCFDHNGEFYSEDEVILGEEPRTEIQYQYEGWLGKGGYVHYGAGDQNIDPQMLLPTEDKVGYLEGELFMLRNELREKFAAMAMQGLLASEIDESSSAPAIAKMAVEHADALLEALNQQESEPRGGSES